MQIRGARVFSTASTNFSQYSIDGFGEPAGRPERPKDQPALRGR